LETLDQIGLALVVGLGIGTTCSYIGSYEDSRPVILDQGVDLLSTEDLAYRQAVTDLSRLRVQTVIDKAKCDASLEISGTYQVSPYISGDRERISNKTAIRVWYINLDDKGKANDCVSKIDLELENTTMFHLEVNQQATSYCFFFNNSFASKEGQRWDLAITQLCSTSGDLLLASDNYEY
jgi:hypothetical protein